MGQGANYQSRNVRVELHGNQLSGISKEENDFGRRLNLAGSNPQSSWFRIREEEDLGFRSHVFRRSFFPIGDNILIFNHAV
ncbi:hypothetical protein HN873_068626 [Arachis hypogaea]